MTQHEVTYEKRGVRSGGHQIDHPSVLSEPFDPLRLVSWTQITTINKHIPLQ